MLARQAPPQDACALPARFAAEAPRPQSAADVTRIETTNRAYRDVFYTHDGDDKQDGAFQDVAMALGYDDTQARSLGAEVHHRTTQYFALADGMACRVIGKTERELTREIVRAGQRWTVPPGWWHDVERIDATPFRLFVQYVPPHHPPGRQDATRADAERRDAAAAEARCVCAYPGCGAIARYAEQQPLGGAYPFCSPRHAALYFHRPL